MFPTLSNSTSLSEEAAASVSSHGTTTRVHDFGGLVVNTKIKKKRNLPGNPDPDAEVIALSPKTLLATNRFVCEVCNKGFQRDQNLQLHRRGHNLPWKLKQRNSKEIKKRAYVCPEPTCVHHHPSRALGDLTGIKKHFCRKHGEKKWKCEKCSKIYAVQSDWKAHSKTCGTREYRCDCGTLFSRKDSFITHRAFCDALAEESARLSANNNLLGGTPTNPSSLLHLHPHDHSNLSSSSSSSLFPFTTTTTQQHFQNPPTQISLTSWNPTQNPIDDPTQIRVQIKNEEAHHFLPIPPPPFFQESPPTQKSTTTTTTTTMITSPCSYQNLLVTNQLQASNSATSSAHLSATALLQKAATIGATTTSTLSPSSPNMTRFDHHLDGFGHEYMAGFGSVGLTTWQKNDHRLTRDFLGLNGECNGVRDHMLTYAGGVGFAACHERENHSLLKPQLHAGFGFAEPPASEAWGDC